MYIYKLASRNSYQYLFQSLGPLQFLMLKCILLGPVAPEALKRESRHVHFNTASQSSFKD